MAPEYESRDRCGVGMTREHITIYQMSLFRPLCHISHCLEPIYELEPGLPTLYCQRHRAQIVKESNVWRKG